jgi:ankyrin repeat protein
VWQIPDPKICAKEGGWLGTADDKEWEGKPLDVMCTSLLYQVYKFSMEVLGIKPDLKLRDVSGQTPLHEAALHGRVLTIRTMAVLTDFEIFEPDNTVQYLQPEGRFDDNGVLLGQRAKIVSMPDSDFVRARPLPRDWAFGWTMMNFVSLASAVRGSFSFATPEGI